MSILHSLENEGRYVASVKWSVSHLIPCKMLLRYCVIPQEIANPEVDRQCLAVQNAAFDRQSYELAHR